MNKTIRLARPLPGSIMHEQQARRMGESCEVVREQIDSAKHRIIFVKFPDGERRVLVDADIADEPKTNSPIAIQAEACGRDCLAVWEEFDVGGEGCI